MRRVVQGRQLRLSLLAALFLMLATAAVAQKPAPHVRMRWQDFVSGPAGQKRLASLQKAVAKMKSLDNRPPGSADFRRSWKYWANIHGYLGPNSKFNTVAFQKQRLNDEGLAQFIPYLVGVPGEPGFTDQTPPDAIAQQVWSTCEHSRETQANFFGWHRMYLYYFERVLRWASGDPTLTLPYWDYTNPAQTALPVEFQCAANPCRDTKSPLYEWRRSEALNEGLATLNPQVTNIDGPLTTDTTYLQYELDIEQGVHGNVHCSVGQTCPVSVMGLVGVAANDPIFYEHHANIDRMWSCWQHSHPAEKPGDWQNQKFTFVDENGAAVTRPVSDFLDTKALGYVYDNDSKCTRAPALLAAAQQKPQAFNNVLGSAKSITLSPTTTSVDVPLPKPVLRGFAGAAPSHTQLVLRNVSSKSDPGALLSVFVAPKNQPANRKYVATVNWFGVFDMAHEGMQQPGPVSRSFQYDITQQLRALGLTETGELTVVFEAASGLVPSAKKPLKLGAAPPPAAKFRPDAALTIGAVELRQ